jgi:DNA repair exonuclease SbcCD ATPase subunit
MGPCPGDGLANASLAAIITRSVYLQQDLVRQFIESESQDRFNAISDLVGTGKITDLQVQLDNARSAWSRATNDMLDKARLQKNRVFDLESQVQKFSAVPGGDAPTGASWGEWWFRVKEFGVGMGYVPAFESPDASKAIDSALNELRARQSADERTKTRIMQLIAEIRSHIDVAPLDTEALKERVVNAQTKLDDVALRLREAQESAAEERREQTMSLQALEELKTLARLALRHLNERCPVCDQSYDQQGTRLRLERIAEPVGTAKAPSDGDPIRELATAVKQHEQDLLQVQSDLQKANRAAQAHNAWLGELDRRLQDLGVKPGSTVEMLKNLETLLPDIEKRSLDLTNAQHDGEGLALRRARSIEGLRRSEVEGERVVAANQLKRLDDELGSRQRTSELATEILEGLREASTEFVEEELRRVEPLLQRVYARVDPHPSFRIVKFLTSFAYRRGRLSIPIFDPVALVTSESPHIVLSSSQLNALAVAVFLSLNLGIAELPLQTAILDDPLQSLDDINLLGVVDLLRRTRDCRQLVVSTHDTRFGDLLARKLRPVSGIQRTRVIEFDGWSRQGPTVVDQRDIGRDPKPLRIAV